MKTRTFLWFVMPSVFLMFLFIAVPLVSVFIQSFYVTSDTFETVEVESCAPSFSGQVCTTEERSQMVLDENEQPVRETRFVGLQSYRNVLEVEEFDELQEDEEAELSDWMDTLSGINFFRALRFTLTFTLITLPFAVGLGLLIAISVNRLASYLKGPLIFVSLLPFIITPVIGAISIKWLFIGDGILTALLEYLLERDIAVFANGWAIEALMMFYRVWHVAPFAFVVFYAGLQTVDNDVLDAATVDGANRWQKFTNIVVPHLMPLIIFVSLIHLMDSFRVFEEIIGFSSEAHRISLQWLTYDYLTPDDSGNRSISRASATAMMTMVGIVILLIPMLKKTWRDHKDN